MPKVTKQAAGRPRQKPEYHEGPEATSRFKEAMKRILQMDKNGNPPASQNDRQRNGKH